MASSHGGLRWRTSLLTVGRPTLPPTPNLGGLLLNGRDIQGIRVDDLFVIGQWLKDSNLRWWRFCQRAELWGARPIASRAVPHSYPLTRILL